MKVAATVPVSPSVTVTSLMVSAGSGSSSVIVPTPIPSPIVAPAAPERLTLKVSSLSSRTSALTTTVTVRVVWPGLKDSAVRGTAV